MNSARRVSPVCFTHADAPPKVSDELRRACAHFAVIPDTQPAHRPKASAPDAHILKQIMNASVVQIAGPSGAGKSTRMRGLRRALSTTRVRTMPDTLDDDQRRTAVFDLLTGDVTTRAAVLSHAGLAEPRLWARPAGMLSCGEQARLRLALTMQAANAGDVVLADEFASSIDRACAYALGRTVSRWARRSGVTLIAASAHEDLEAMLGPDLVIDAATGQPRPPRRPQTQTIVIEPGTHDDYRQLAHLHYRAASPGVVVQTLRAVRRVPPHIDASGQMLAGVLQVSMPTLNSAWRKRAWPGHFDSADKTANALGLNAQLRTISRVIVEPRSRGLGVATQLVRAYLQHPLSVATEAIAAMGSICPFFERAGMTPYQLLPDATDTRLLDALDHLSTEPWALLHARIQPGSLLMRELVTWGKARKLLPKGHVSNQDIQRLTPIAAFRLCSRPRAYAFVKGEHEDARHQDP